MEKGIINKNGDLIPFLNPILESIFNFDFSDDDLINIVSSRLYNQSIIDQRLVQMVKRKDKDCYYFVTVYKDDYETLIYEVFFVNKKYPDRTKTIGPTDKKIFHNYDDAKDYMESQPIFLS